MIFKIKENIFVRLTIFIITFLCMVGLLQIIIPYDLIYLGLDLFFASILSFIVYIVVFKMFKYYNLIIKINDVIIKISTISIILLSIYVLFIFLLLNNCYKSLVFNQYNIKIFYFLFPFFLQASTEEFIFRGIILFELKNKIGNIFSMFITSIIFALMHILNPNFTFVALFNTFLAGIFFSQMVLYSNSLIPSIIFHTLWNYILAYVLGINLSGYIYDNSLFKIDYKKMPPEVFGGNYGLEASILTTLFLVISIFLLYNIYQKLSFRRQF